MKSKMAIVLLFAAIFLLPQFISAQNETKAEWTLMFYMDADNNLEAPQMTDLREMMAVGSGASINIVVLADRSVKGEEEEGYTSGAVGGLKNWTTAKLMVVEKGRLREIADWGEVNMGDAATLKKFGQAVAAQFPAKRYGLIFGNHGKGWHGIVSDESEGDGDTLTTKELPLALKEITAQAGKLELIGFDACLMGNLESASAVAPFAKTMVASEELEPGDGWYYTPFLGTLAKNPNMDGAALGKVIVDSYRDFYLGADEGNRDKTVTLGVISLDKIPALETAVNNLAARNQTLMNSDGRASWLKTARARAGAEEYGKSSSVYYFDVSNYAENIKREYSEAETVKAADAVIAAVKSAVVYKINGEGRPRSSGISIYFPPDKDNFLGNPAFQYNETPFSLTSKWLPFLAGYTGAELADTQAPQLENVATTDENITKNDVVTVTAQVKADDIEEANFVLAESNDDEQIIIGSIPAEPDEKGVLSEEWDGSWFTIGDGKKELICPITNFEKLDDAKDVYLAEVPAQIRFRGTKNWRDITLYFMLDFNKEEVVGEFVYAFSSKENQASEIEIEAGDSIRPVYLSIDNKGEESLTASDDENDILNVTKDNFIAVGRADVAAGKYLIGFTATDFAGNTSEEFTEVTIE